MKIYNQGRRVNGRFDSVKAFCGRVWFAMKVLAGVFVLMLVSGYVGAMVFSTATVSTTNAVEVVQAKDTEAPVLARIADCESGAGKVGGARQFNADGSIVVHVNDNGTSDVGRYQINMSAYHLKEMAKLGFNPLTDEGNTAYAKYLYENKGTGDWASSSKCWAR